MCTAIRSRGGRTRSPATLAALLTLGLATGAARAEEQSDFVSANTVIVGCTAGGGASAFAAVLPLLSTAASGPAAPVVTPTVVAAWTGIGCAVGVVSALIAIGTAWVMENDVVAPLDIELLWEPTP